MKMKLVNVFKRFGRRTGKFLKRHGTTIMSVTACVGVIGTAVTTAKAYKQTEDELEEMQGTDATAFEKIKTVAPHFILPVGLGSITCGLIIGSNVIDKRQQASLIAGYAALDQAYRQYRAKVNTLVNDGNGNPDALIKNDISKDNFRSLKHLERPNSKDLTLFYEENSEQFFWSTMADVVQAEYDLNRQFTGLLEASLNDLCRAYGINDCEFGNELGWNAEDGEEYFGYRWIDFEHVWVDAKEFSDMPELQTEDEEILSDVPGYFIIRTPFPPHLPLYFN